MPKKQTTEEVIAAFKVKHGDCYDYAKTIYKGASKKVVVICADHGAFKILPGHHKSGTGCRHCYFRSRKISRDDFLAKARSKHGRIYDYSAVPDTFRVSADKIIITCTLHAHSFEQSASNHMHGHTGCPQCRSDILSGPASDRGKKKRKSRIVLAQEFIVRSKEVHGDALDYSDFEYCGVNAKSTFICKIHGPFQQNLSNHLRNGGCPECARKRRGAGSFKRLCHESGINYWRALKRRGAGMSEARIFEEAMLRSEREVNGLVVYGEPYPNLEAACRVLEPMASSATIARWMKKGMSAEEAFERVPNPGVSNGIVYLVEHKQTGKQYVGLTVQALERRWDFHRQQAVGNRIRNMQSLHAAIRKEGIDAFSIRQIDKGQTKKDLEGKERDWIEVFDSLVPNGYNIHRGGVSGGSNKQPTEIDEILFPGKREAAEYLMKKVGISYSAAKKRVQTGRYHVRTPAKPGESLVKSKAYKAWSHIVHTATNPKASKDYIPGLDLHASWQSFDTFLADVGHPTSPDLIFARLDKSRGFFPDNCAWITRSKAASLAAIWASKNR